MIKLLPGFEELRYISEEYMVRLLHVLFGGEVESFRDPYALEQIYYIKNDDAGICEIKTLLDSNQILEDFLFELLMQYQVAMAYFGSANMKRLYVSYKSKKPDDFEFIKLAQIRRE